MNIGRRLKKACLSKGLTQTDAAKRINVTNQVVSNWERDYSKATADDIRMLSIIYECTSDYLIGLSDSFLEKESKFDNIVELTDYEKIILEYFEDKKEWFQNNSELLDEFLGTYDEILKIQTKMIKNREYSERIE